MSKSSSRPVFGLILFDRELDLIKSVNLFESLPLALAALVDLRNVEINNDEEGIDVQVVRDPDTGNFLQVLLFQYKDLIATVRVIEVNDADMCEAPGRQVAAIAKKLQGRAPDEALETALIHLLN
jgi:hypothetical protein